MRHNLAGDFLRIKANEVAKETQQAEVKRRKGEETMKRRRGEEKNNALTPYRNEAFGE